MIELLHFGTSRRRHVNRVRDKHALPSIVNIGPNGVSEIRHPTNWGEGFPQRCQPCGGSPCPKTQSPNQRAWKVRMTPKSTPPNHKTEWMYRLPRNPKSHIVSTRNLLWRGRVLAFFGFHGPMAPSFGPCPCSREWPLLWGSDWRSCHSPGPQRALKLLMLPSRRASSRSQRAEPASFQRTPKNARRHDLRHTTCVLF